MKAWPVPDSFTKELPKKGAMGSFWEDRGDRYNCGIDIFAPDGSNVVSLESGYIIDIGQFTKQGDSGPWNDTQFVILRTSQKVLIKFACLREVFVKIGDYVDVGQELGTIGSMIDMEMLSYDDPLYLQELADKESLSMLHMEFYKAPVTQVKPYSAGNFLGERRPESLIDPSLYLKALMRTIQSQHASTSNTQNIISN